MAGHVTLVNADQTMHMNHSECVPSTCLPLLGDTRNGPCGTKTKRNGRKKKKAHLQIMDFVAGSRSLFFFFLAIT